MHVYDAGAIMLHLLFVIITFVTFASNFGRVLQLKFDDQLRYSTILNSVRRFN